MKWKSKSKRGKGKKKDGPSSPTRNNMMGPPAAGPVTPARSRGPGLGTLRVGTLRPEGAPICTPTPGSRRQLISDLLGPDTDGEGEDPTSAGVAASPALRSMISKKSSTGDSSKELSEEKAVFASHLNTYLAGDPFLKHVIPLNPGGTNFLDSFKDGVLMCRLICLAIPGSIADAEINVPTDDEPLSLYRSNENLNIALQAAEAGGVQVVNIGASDIIEGRPSSILGLTWQLIRVHLLAQINLKGCPDLIHLMEEGEDREDFFKLAVEDVLLRWFNHHLRWGGSERRVSNFGDDLADGKCYITLIKELNDHFKGDETDPNDEDVKRAAFRRACHVISGAEGIGVAPLIRANHITGKAHLYNIAFVAQLLNRRPRIHRESLHLGASIVMQAWFRMVIAMRRVRPLLGERRASAEVISRACQRWIMIRNRQRAATTLQAMWRGREGRVVASKRRSVMAKEQAEKAKARAREEAAVRAREEAAVRAREEAAAVAREKAAALAREAAAARAREEAALERQREVTAVTTLQAWARGMASRKAISAALAARGLPPLWPKRRRRESLRPDLKGCQMGQEISSPRTSVSSSVRFSEDSLDPGARSIGSMGVPGGKVSSSWFDKVFSGMSFNLPDRAAKNPKRTDAAAAMVIQRWQRRLAQARRETARAQGEVARRRWAVDKLHSAYTNTWRFKVSALREDRLKLEDERLREKEVSGGFGDFWTKMKSKLSPRGDDGSSWKGWGARRKTEEKGKGNADCCDTVGHGVLASEIEAWNVSYLAEQVFGTPGVGEAQEARARALSRMEDIESEQVRWSAPEEALTTGKVFAMVSVLLTVAFEVVLPNAAAIGA